MNKKMLRRRKEESERSLILFFTTFNRNKPSAFLTIMYSQVFLLNFICLSFSYSQSDFGTK